MRVGGVRSGLVQRTWALAEMLRAVSLLTGGEGRWWDWRPVVMSR